MIQKYGYPAETHNITTADGYILTVFRIPHGRTQSQSTRGPVYLHHGVLLSSSDWLMNRIDTALGILINLFIMGMHLTLSQGLVLLKHF